MKVYVDANDIGKTVTFKEENGKRQYLYVHDKEGFIIKSLEDYKKKFLDDIKEFVINNFEVTISKSGEFVASIGLEKLNKFLKEKEKC